MHVCACMCVHVYTHAHTPSDMGVCICMCVCDRHVYMCCMHVHVCALRHTEMCICVHTHAEMPICIHVRAPCFVCMHAHRHVHLRAPWGRVRAMGGVCARGGLHHGCATCCIPDAGHMPPAPGLAPSALAPSPPIPHPRVTRSHSLEGSPDGRPYHTRLAAGFQL